jgi:ribosome-binding protein aMBF1 (putative translation factor)
MDPQDREKLTRGLRRMFHEATDEELNDALEHAGIDPKELAARGRAAGQRALAAVGEDTEEVLQLHKCLGALVRLLRSRDGLSIEQLADKARVDPKELESIEADPGFEPNPRTIVQLEKHFQMKSRTLVLLSGAVTVDDDVRDEAVRFAANSENILKLDRKQKRMVNDFVRFLRDHTD